MLDTGDSPVKTQKRKQKAMPTFHVALVWPIRGEPVVQQLRQRAQAHEDDIDMKYISTRHSYAATWCCCLASGQRQNRRCVEETPGGDGILPVMKTAVWLAGIDTAVATLRHRIQHRACEDIPPIDGG